MGEVIIVVIDILLLAGGFLTAYYVKQLGGGIGHKSLKIMVWGFLLLGIAHIIETFLVALFPKFDVELLELSHRVLVLAALALIMIGYSRLVKFVRS